MPIPPGDDQRHIYHFPMTSHAGSGYSSQPIKLFPANQRAPPIDFSPRSFPSNDSIFPPNIRERDIKSTFLYQQQQNIYPNPVLSTTNPLPFGANMDNCRPSIDRSYFPSKISASQISNPGDISRLLPNFPDMNSSSISPMTMPPNQNFHSAAVRMGNHSNNKSSDRKVTTAQIHFSYVSNRPAAVTLGELQNLFSHFGNILSVSLKKSQVNKVKNIC